jgi:hypothetical protein
VLKPPTPEPLEFGSLTHSVCSRPSIAGSRRDVIRERVHDAGQRQDA